MSWDNIVLSLQETSNTLLAENTKAISTKAKPKAKNKVKSKNIDDDSTNGLNQISLDVLLKVSKQLTTTLEDVEMFLKEKDVSFNTTSLATDESIHDLIPSNEADDIDNENLAFEGDLTAGRTAISSKEMSANSTSTNTTMTYQSGLNAKGRGRGRPQGSTNSRLQGSGVSASAVSSKSFSAHSNNTASTNAEADEGSDNTAVNSTNSVGNSSSATGAAVSDKLITIGARYGYPPPPPLSSYNGKIGRSFYTSAYNPSTPILPNSQVAYCPSNGRDGANNFATMHSEWILCRVLRVISETRFEIQDPEPDEMHPQGQVFRANYKEIILVPLHLVSSSISKLKEYKSGTRVLAKYPETTTFYPAEVMASKHGNCMLRFEGEEEVGKLTPVDRVFVLPCPK
ncbi:hypothetical protein PICMEDRAFT_71807 [Pichia membranifaciens NRRL Y-2026]|uniref:SGF29 C-terminal domain-containing protein n=1 Tax=Pichia membranifaciens NRRL Y-2026 TaxID=763406 RepID=A0A1E3NNW0_9ASCO|nr:hypothetical protein PICMEDRAFT_71807 [Pichia membranifaciens NRRL Y-2026]ODQ47775.1 hypothetical protein PICMEDRAFT_71807 [Pichia membranifaciens NRRL Y-2026]